MPHNNLADSRGPLSFGSPTTPSLSTSLPGSIPIIPVQDLDASHLDRLSKHFAGLSDEDLCMRFAYTPSPKQISDYLQRIDFAKDSIFGIFDEDLNVIGVAHLGCFDHSAELGLSVLPIHRNKGLGSRLFQRALMRARNQQVVELFMHCLSQNDTMTRMAHRAGMRIIEERGEQDAYLELPPGTPLTLGQELIEQQLALFDWTARSHFAYLRQSQLGKRRL